MRLLPFGSRVKFRRCRGFGGKLPSFVQGRAPPPVGPPAKLHESPEHQRQESPPAPSEKPRDKAVTPAKALLPSALELRKGKSSRLQHTLLEVTPGDEPLKQRIQGTGRIPSSELSDGGNSEGVGRVSRRGRAAQRAVQRAQVRHCSPHHGEVELQRSQPLPLSRRPRRVTFVEPEWHPNRDGPM